MRPALAFGMACDFDDLVQRGSYPDSWVQVYSGHLGFPEFRCMAAEFGAAEAGALIDLSAAKIEMTGNEIIRCGLLMRAGTRDPEARYAFVVAGPAAFSVVRMLSYWARISERCGIFSSRADAERWLEAHRLRRDAMVWSERVA